MDISAIGGDYVELTEVAIDAARLEFREKGIDTRFEDNGRTNNGVDSGKENIQLSRSTRASLYRSKIPKVSLNPVQPLSNPYRVSQHDQMPIRVIPSPMGKKAPLKQEPPPVRKVKLGGVSMRDVRLSPQNKAASMDNLLMASSHHCYATRSVLKRVDELSKLDESNFSLSSVDSEKNPEFSQTMTRNKLRMSKTRKYRQKFNFGIFTKNSKSKSKSEFALNETKNIEYMDTPRKQKKFRNEMKLVPFESCKTEEVKEERSLVRNKRRLSGIRLRFHKKFGPKDLKFSEEDSKSAQTSTSQVSPAKRKAEVICNHMCDDFNIESNNNEPMSLLDVLNNKDLCEEFRQFLASEHSDENLDFWTMCEIFKTSTDRCNLAEIIRKQFLRMGAPREVNLDANTRSILNVNIDSLDPSSFTSAQDSIYRLMEADPFRRFCSTRRNKRMKTR